MRKEVLLIVGFIMAFSVAVNAEDSNATSKVDDSVIDFSELDELDNEIAQGKEEIAQGKEYGKQLDKEIAKDKKMSDILTALIVTGGKTK